MDPETGDFSQPDESQQFSKRRVQIVHLGGGIVRRVEVDPGWRWAEHERSETGTPSCRLPHLGYVVSGALEVSMDDGPRLEVAAGQVFVIPPGHDARTLGAEACVFVDFAGTHGHGL